MRLLASAWVRLLLIASVCCSLAGPGSVLAAEPVTFRVMSYNIHHGEGLDKKVDLERIAELIKREKADLIGLQEVDKGVERTARRDLPAELSKLTGMACVFSNNYAFQGGEYGNAILSRYPVKASSNRHYKMLHEGEQRGIMQVTVDIAGQPVVFMNTHIDFRPNDAERVLNVGEIRELVNASASLPVIICGDFNDVPGSRTCQRLSEFLVDSWTLGGKGDGFTIPARKANKRIDFIWISRDAPFKPRNVWVPESEASDHRPVVAEFEFTRRAVDRAN